MAYYNIKERKDQDEDPFVKIPSPLRKINKWTHFANIVWNWMITQSSLDQITPLVYLVREEDNVLSDRELNQLARLDVIIYGTPLSGE